MRAGGESNRRPELCSPVHTEPTGTGKKFRALDARRGKTHSANGGGHDSCLLWAASCSYSVTRILSTSSGVPTFPSFR